LHMWKKMGNFKGGWEGTLYYCSRCSRKNYAKLARSEHKKRRLSEREIFFLLLLLHSIFRNSL